MSVRHLAGCRIPGARRTIRLFINTDSTGADTVRRFGYVAQDRARASLVPIRWRLWVRTLVLHRGEPTAIWVINRALEPTAIHWHGMELESPFDGVVGVGGYTGAQPHHHAGRLLPGPDDSPAIRNVHVPHPRQRHPAAQGWSWARCWCWNPEPPTTVKKDLVFILVNVTWRPGAERPESIRRFRWKPGQRYRLSPAQRHRRNAEPQYWLAGSGPTVLWRPSRVMAMIFRFTSAGWAAEEFVAMGQIADFEFVAPSRAPWPSSCGMAPDCCYEQPFTLARP